MAKPGEAGVLDVAEVFGERKAIQNYPALIQAMVAETQNPKSSEAMLSEFSAFFSILGWHQSIRLREDELGESGSRHWLSGASTTRLEVLMMSVRASKQFRTLGSRRHPLPTLPSSPILSGVPGSSRRSGTRS